PRARESAWRARGGARRPWTISSRLLDDLVVVALHALDLRVEVGARHGGAVHEPGHAHDVGHALFFERLEAVAGEYIHQHGLDLEGLVLFAELLPVALELPDDLEELGLGEHRRGPAFVARG